MALTLSDFTTAFPELNVPDPLTQIEQDKITAILLRVESIHITSTTFYGAKTTFAQLLMSAHLYIALRDKTRHGSMGVGPISSRTNTDGSSVSSSAQNFDRADQQLLSTTSYGRELMKLDFELSACLTGFVV